jgi:hypothetical protein
MRMRGRGIRSVVLSASGVVELRRRRLARHERRADAVRPLRASQFTEPWMDFWKTGVLFVSNL